MILHPVELAVSVISRRERFGVHRDAGRRALARAAEQAGAPPLRFARDADGAPVSENGWHHSLANTRGLVVAVVAPCPIGIDAEAFARPRLDNLLDYLGDEPRSLDSDPRRAALRLWSAKEAVLKLLGLGVGGLPQCRLISAQGERLELQVDCETYACAQVLRPEHVVSIACTESFDVEWRPASREREPGVIETR